MFLLLLEYMNKVNNLIFQVIIVWFLEILFLDFFEINNIRPDFLVIVILYWSIKFGRTLGIVSGFFIGLLADLAGTATFFGLSSLTYSVTGYLSGNLKGLFNKVNPFLFTLFWISIIFIQAFIFCVFHNQNLLSMDIKSFYEIFMGTGFYTVSFIIILQMIYPIHKI